VTQDFDGVSRPMPPSVGAFELAGQVDAAVPADLGATKDGGGDPDMPRPEDDSDGGAPDLGAAGHPSGCGCDVGGAPPRSSLAMWCLVVFLAWRHCKILRRN